MLTAQATQALQALLDKNQLVTDPAELIVYEIDAAQDLHIRFHGTRGSMDLGKSAGGLPPDSVVEDTDAVLAATEEAIDRFHDPAPESMVRIAVAPSAPFTVTEGLMRASAELARRELAQETGLRARELTQLGFLTCAHGRTGQGFHAFLATGLTQGRPDREAEEQDMRHQWVSRAEFTGMVRRGAIVDDATVAAYTLLLLHEEGAAAGLPQGPGPVSA